MLSSAVIHLLCDRNEEMIMSYISKYKLSQLLHSLTYSLIQNITHFL